MWKKGNYIINKCDKICNSLDEKGMREEKICKYIVDNYKKKGKLIFIFLYFIKEF